MTRRRQVVQRQRRRKPYRPEASAAATAIKPKGAFRVFSSYRLFAIIGAVVLVGGYAISGFSGGRIGHGAGGGGGGHNRSNVRGEGVRRTDQSDEAGAPASSAAANIKQYATLPTLAIDPQRRYVATIATDAGDVTVELLPSAAPQAVNNFVFLARDGFYNGVSFYRVIPGFVAQAGDPTGSGIGGPGYDLPFERSSLPVDAGVLVAAKPSEAGAPNNGSQFFFALDRLPTLDGTATVFGRVIGGLDVLQRLAPRDPQREPDAPPGSVITSISVTES